MSGIEVQLRAYLVFPQDELQVDQYPEIVRLLRGVQETNPDLAQAYYSRFGKLHPNFTATYPDLLSFDSSTALAHRAAPFGDVETYLDSPEEGARDDLLAKLVHEDTEVMGQALADLVPVLRNRPHLIRPIVLLLFEKETPKAILAGLEVINHLDADQTEVSIKAGSLRLSVESLVPVDHRADIIETLRGYLDSPDPHMGLGVRRALWRLGVRDDPRVMYDYYSRYLKQVPSNCINRHALEGIQEMGEAARPVFPAVRNVALGLHAKAYPGFSMPGFVVSSTIGRTDQIAFYKDLIDFYNTIFPARPLDSGLVAHPIQRHPLISTENVPHKKLQRYLDTLPGTRSAYRALERLDERGSKVRVSDYLSLAQSYEKWGRHVAAAVVYDELSYRLEESTVSSGEREQCRAKFYDVADRWLVENYFGLPLGRRVRSFDDPRASAILHLFTGKPVDAQDFKEAVAFPGDNLNHQISFEFLRYQKKVGVARGVYMGVKSTNERKDWLHFFLHRHRITDELIPETYAIGRSKSSAPGTGRILLRKLAQFFLDELKSPYTVATIMIDKGLIYWPRLNYTPISQEQYDELGLQYVLAPKKGAYDPVLAEPELIHEIYRQAMAREITEMPTKYGLTSAQASRLAAEIEASKMTARDVTLYQLNGEYPIYGAHEPSVEYRFLSLLENLLEERLGMRGYSGIVMIEDLLAALDPSGGNGSDTNGSGEVAVSGTEKAPEAPSVQGVSGGLEYGGQTYARPVDIFSELPIVAPGQDEVGLPRVAAYAQAMAAGEWDWDNMIIRQPDGTIQSDPILIGITPSKRLVLGEGHSRFLAAYVAGVPIPESALEFHELDREPPTFNWNDVKWHTDDKLYSARTPPDITDVTTLDDVFTDWERILANYERSDLVPVVQVIRDLNDPKRLLRVLNRIAEDSANVDWLHKEVKDIVSSSSGLGVTGLQFQVASHYVGMPPVSAIQSGALSVARMPVGK